MSEPDIVWFGDEHCRDVACAGGKGASLAAMSAAGLQVPAGFVVPSWVLERAIGPRRRRARAGGRARAGSRAAAERDRRGLYGARRRARRGALVRVRRGL